MTAEEHCAVIKEAKQALMAACDAAKRDGIATRFYLVAETILTVEVFTRV